MEVKINKEIRNYTESIFFGLSLRQFIFSLLACSAAVSVYFLLRDSLGTETVSWICIVVAFPFGAIGFIRYNGLYFEQLVIAVIRSELLLPARLLFQPTDIYYEAVKSYIAEKKKEMKKNNA